MLGYIGTVLVVVQMSALSLDAPQWALLIGLAASVAWFGHGKINRDKPIMITNGLLFFIAAYGIISNL